MLFGGGLWKLCSMLYQAAVETKNDDEHSTDDAGLAREGLQVSLRATLDSAGLFV